MKKLFVLFIALAVTAAVVTSASAQIRFKDVPDDHWAASSVYDLVKLGVTKGYPDGTFRGKKKITRYETAVFLAKLSKAIGAGAGVKAEIAALKRDVAALKRGGVAGGLPISGGYLASWKFGNLLTETGGIRGAVASYRLKLSTTQNFGEGANVKINLDTMDYGYFNDGQTTTGGVLATELLDIEGNLKLNLAALGLANPVDLKVTYGPGVKLHAPSVADPLPSEVGVAYIRPYTGITGTTKLMGADVSGGYTAISHATSGRVTASEIAGTLGYAFEGVPVVDNLEVAATGRYVSSGMFSSSSRDLRASIAMAAPLGDKIEAGGTFDLGGTATKTWMVAGSLALNDVWDTGTVAVIKASKIGSEFINPNFSAAEFDYAGFDSFNRLLGNGTVNLGGEVVQNVSEDIKLVGKGDLRLQSNYTYEAPNGRLTAQGGVLYAVAPNTTLDAFYRIYQDKSTNDTSDVAALGLLYSF